MSRRPEVGLPTSCPPPEEVEEIRTQLERVLTSQQFRSSRRCQALLRHVTEHALAGDTATLKERTLGIEVFGRTPDYDTSQDPVVRATAAETRKKLAQYYQNAQHEAEPRIELLPGSYVPEFHANHAEAVRRERPGQWGAVALGSAGAAMLMLIALAATLLPRWQQSDLERFWDPVLRARGDVLISLGQPVAYNLVSAQAQDRIQFREEGAPAAPSIPLSELVVLRDRYIALGDAMCLVRLTALFEKHGKTYHIRGEASTSFADLKENSAVLIAAFDNQWTLRAAGQLRFTFVKDSAHDTDMVRDRLHPEKTDWKLKGAWPHWNITNDYAIVSRIRDVNTDRPVVIAAGITQFGTLGAGEFLSNPEYFSEAVSELPRDWAHRNLQIVLGVPVVHGASGHPRVLATHVW